MTAMLKFTRLLSLCLLLGCCACFKKPFDAPADKRTYDPQLPVTHSIAQLLGLPQGVAIDSDVVVSGIVVMDDRSGNYYKKLVIQDSSGGIEILAGQNNLYNDYPVGRKVYIKCKGLFLGADGLNPQLGYTPDAAGSVSDIPGILLGNFIVKAMYPCAITPDTLSLADLAAPSAARKHLNTLVVIKNAEFADEHAGMPYAQLASIATATNLTVKDCAGGKITMRNSGFAKFQPYLTPAGNGLLCGIYTRYNNTAQLCIRDTGDVQFYRARCSGSGPAGTPVVRVDSLRRLFSGSTVTLPALKVRGIVISDKDNGNISGGNIIFQGGNDDKGIILYYGGSSTAYALGDSLEVTLTGCSLKQYNGKLEIEGVTAAKTTRLATKRRITPRTATIAQLLAAPGQYESTLVKILQATFQAGATTYNGNVGNLNISDPTGTIKHYCTMGTTFKDDPLPAGTVSAITGYVDLFSGAAQLRIRKPGAPVNDVVP